MFFYYLIIVSLFIFILFGEFILLRRALNKIPVRIIVNGTRGKSTTVRILFEVLRASGQKVFARTTGNSPQIFHPDGSVQTLKRIAPASIIENRNILWRWAKHHPDAVIMECMALQPETQRTLSRSIFKPTVTIITNILPDHKEVMGQTLNDIGQSIAECFYKNTEIFIPKTDNARKFLKNLNITQVHHLQITPCSVNLPNIPQSVLDESWTLIHAVATHLKISPHLISSVFQKLWQEINDSFEQKSQQQTFYFFNLFSANDVQSARLFIDHFLQRKKSTAKTVFYLNCRADRPLRTKDFTELLTRNYKDAEIWLTGDDWSQAYRVLRKVLPVNMVVKQPAERALQAISALLDKEIYFFGIGNHKGIESFLNGMEHLLNGK